MSLNSHGRFFRGHPEGTTTPRHLVPDSILEFLEAGGGRSLIIKGRSGTGKTTLSLQLIESLGKLHDSFYISTRVSDGALYQQFKWLKEKEWRERILDTSRGFLRAIQPEEWETPSPGDLEQDKVTRASKKFLKEVYQENGGAPTRVDRTLLNRLLMQYDMPELAHLYDRIEAILPRSALVVMDSLEGLAERTDIAPPRLLLTFQKDLVEGTGVRLVIVLENESATYLDYLVDGVMSMQRSELDGRRLREFTLEKLRGTEIRNPKQLFTLTSGRFKCIPPFQMRPSKEPRKWEPVPDPPGYFSTGIPDLDAVLGGGFMRGTNVLIEFGDNLDQGAYELLVNPLLANFVSHGRAVMVIPFNEQTSEDFRKLAEQAGGPGSAEKHLRVAEKIALDRDQAKPHIITMGFEDMKKDYERWERERNRLRNESKQPVLELIALETQEARFGEESYKSALSVSSELAKKEGDLIVRVSKPGLPSLTQRVANASGQHLRVRRVDGAVVVYGERPETPPFVVEQDTSRGFPRPRLTPIS